MNRPIKFMQQLTDGTWHHWGFLKEGCFIGPIANSPKTWSESFEFTGRFDKNETEIYEGHKIKSDLSLLEYVVVWEEFKTRFIGKRLHKGGGMTVALSYNWNNHFEIIGHIAEEER